MDGADALYTMEPYAGSVMEPSLLHGKGLDGVEGC